mgnify:FL=1
MNKKKVALVLFVFIVLIAYAGYLIIRIVQNPTVTFFVEKGDLTLEESTVGYILRSETLVKGENYKNGIVKIKNEGEKVSKGEAIFRYYSNGEEAIRKQIKEVNDKIDKVFSQESKVIPKDIKTLEDQITSNLDKLYQLNDLKKIAEHKKEMNQYITKKSQIIGEQSPAGSYLKELMNQKADLENRLSANREYITAPNPGVISYRVDGLENVLTTTNFDYLNKDFLEGLDIKNAQVIASSNEAGKIVDNFKTYIVCFSKSENAENAKQNSSIKIRLPSDKEAIATLVEKKKDGDEWLMIYQINSGSEELMNYRKLSFDLIWWHDSGLRIPNEAIKKDEKGTSYIIRKRSGAEEKVYVKVLRQNQNYAIVDNYSSDELAQKGYTKEEAKKVSLYDEITL